MKKVGRYSRANLSGKWQYWKTVFFSTEEEALEFKATLRGGLLFKGTPRSKTIKRFREEVLRSRGIDAEEYPYCIVYRIKPTDDIIRRFSKKEA